MSTFGWIVIIAFMLLTGGAVMMYVGDNKELAISKLMMFFMIALVVAEGVLAIIEFPLYVVDGIVFISMGEEKLAYIMFIIYAIIILFILFFIIPKIRWSSLLTVSPVKLVVIGVMLISLLAYTELYNGAYSFDSGKEYTQVKAKYAKYDEHFFPTKILKLKEGGHYSVYPFDVECAAGKLDFVYRAEIAEMTVTDEDGNVIDSQMYFYPFTYKAYEDSEPVAFTDPTYDPTPEEVTKTDVSASDADTEKKTEQTAAPAAGIALFSLRGAR